MGSSNPAGTFGSTIPEQAPEYPGFRPYPTFGMFSQGYIPYELPPPAGPYPGGFGATPGSLLTPITTQASTGGPIIPPFGGGGGGGGAGGGTIPGADTSLRGRTVSAARNQFLDSLNLPPEIRRRSTLAARSPLATNRRETGGR